MITVIHKKRSHAVPQSWDELSPKQFLSIIGIITVPHDGIKARLLILKELLSMQWWQFKLIGDEQLVHMLWLTDWIESDSQLTRQLVQVIYAGGALYGPKDGYDNIRTGEFHFADLHYTLWKSTHDENELYRFLAVLYRPGRKKYNLLQDPDGDRREPFNDNLIDYYANRIRHYCGLQSNPAIPHAALFCYESWRSGLEKKHPRVFSVTNKSKASIDGWFPIFRGIAKDGTYGNLDSVSIMYLNSLLLELELIKDEEEQMRKHNPELFKNKSI